MVQNAMKTNAILSPLIETSKFLVIDVQLARI